MERKRVRDDRQKGREETESETDEERKTRLGLGLADFSSRRKFFAHFPAPRTQELFLAPIKRAT